jgi:hypothetical protein
VITLASGAVLKAGLAHHDFVRAQERRLQSEWLAESGIQRALARLAVDRDYPGERWVLTAADLGLPEPPRAAGTAHNSDQAAAVVAITVDPVKSAAGTRAVHVRADYPPDAPGRSRHSKHVLIDLETRKPGVTP